MQRIKHVIRQHLILVIAVTVMTATYAAPEGTRSTEINDNTGVPAVLNQKTTATEGLAADTLETLPIKGRAPKTGYSRHQFGNGWGVVGNCDMRNLILRRDMSDAVIKTGDNCAVLSGNLYDPYTGTIIRFRYGSESSQAVQIDHVVALSDAWQKGAQALPPQDRNAFANDPLNLLAVDGPANMKKGDSDAATWLPPNKAYRCRYVARQIAVKAKYRLWATAAERDAMQRVLGSCPDQQLPAVNP